MVPFVTCIQMILWSYKSDPSESKAILKMKSALNRITERCLLNRIRLDRKITKHM